MDYALGIKFNAVHLDLIAKIFSYDFFSHKGFIVLSFTFKSMNLVKFLWYKV